MFSCEYCKNFKDSFFYRTPPVAAFVVSEYASASTEFHSKNPLLSNYFIVFPGIFLFGIENLLRERKKKIEEYPVVIFYHLNL